MLKLLSELTFQFKLYTNEKKYNLKLTRIFQIIFYISDDSGSTRTL